MSDASDEECRAVIAQVYGDGAIWDGSNRGLVTAFVLARRRIAELERELAEDRHEDADAVADWARIEAMSAADVRAELIADGVYKDEADVEAHSERFGLRVHEMLRLCDAGARYGRRRIAELERELAGYRDSTECQAALDAVVDEREVERARADAADKRCDEMEVELSEAMHKIRIVNDQIARICIDPSYEPTEYITDATGKVLSLRRRAEAAERDRNELLARIHGDGGHYTDEHGVEKALADAHKLVAKWRAAEEVGDG